MFAIAKAVLLALAVTGIAATGAVAGVTHVPLQKAIDTHKEHLGQNSTMPMESKHGQQNALDRLMENQQRLMSKPHNETGDHELNDTDDNELDEIDDSNEQELNEVDNSGFGGIFGVLGWLKAFF